MRYSKIVICLFTLILVMVGVAVSSVEETEYPLPDVLSFTVDSGEKTEYIDCWENSGQTVYVFLPGYADLSKVHFQLEENGLRQRDTGEGVRRKRHLAVLDRQGGLHRHDAVLRTDVVVVVRRGAGEYRRREGGRRTAR